MIRLRHKGDENELTLVEQTPQETVGVEFDSFSTRLMQEEPEELQRRVYDQLLPQPGGYMLDSPDADGEAVRALGIPVTYLLAEHDRALAAPGAELAARVGATPVIVPGTHEALLTHPDDGGGSTSQAQ